MKKRRLILLGIITCIVSMISCNTQEKQTEEGMQMVNEAPIQEEKLKEGMIFLGEEMYDLTEESHEVIGSMITNGVIVADSLTRYLYDTNGKVSERDFYELRNEGVEIENLIEVHIDNISATYSSNVILAEFLLANNDTAYRTWDGITQYSEEEDLKCLEGYMPCAVSAGRTAYACIYVDGKPISWLGYKESLEVLMKAKEENQLKEIFKEYLKEACYVPKAITCVRRKGMDGLEKGFDNKEIEGALWIMLAAQDAAGMLDSAEITSYDIVVYEKVEDRMWCKVYHYYYDDAWDPRKYWNEEDDYEVD